ncbi:MAG: hypothetical protein NTZ16_12120 [Verrucomicrobia bacterium]|nr:hypothetical protein [Verrucomicrobiota bacterium]
MNIRTQTVLSGIAGKSGLAIHYSDVVRISGFQDAPDSIEIGMEQPDSEIIHAILQAIGRAQVTGMPFKYPWYVNRPYENQTAGDIVYKTRRMLRIKCDRKWRADLWALCAFPMLGCRNEFKDFLERHPKKLILMPLVILAFLKQRLGRFLKKPFRFLVADS